MEGNVHVRIRRFILLGGIATSPGCYRQWHSEGVCMNGNVHVAKDQKTYPSYHIARRYCNISRQWQSEGVCMNGNVRIRRSILVTILPCVVDPG